MDDIKSDIKGGWSSRTEMLLGGEAMEKLKNARVAVFGLGGVGGYAAEALARSGVGAIDLVDGDEFTLTNLNRQILATRRTLGRNKAEVAAERIKDINPECEARAFAMFYRPDCGFDLSIYDYVADAIDSVKDKLSIITRAQAAGVPVISAMGAGNKLDPSGFKVADIYSTSVCPLAKTMRRELKKLGVKSLKTVYSEEPPLSPLFPAPQENAPIKPNAPGSTAFAPAAAGLVMAAEIVKDIISTT